VDPEVVALFHELADRTRAEREQIYGERETPEAVRLEVESLLGFDGRSAHSLADGVAAAVQDAFGADEPPIGATISHYRILERLGSGGFGVVYKAQDVRLGRLVALKLLAAGVAADPHALDRFRREASAASALNHSHVCTIHDIGHDADRHFIVMELLQGATLKERLFGGPLPVEEVVGVGVQIAVALAAVHAAGIIHRDIKPANIFITSDGQAKLLDFGVAKLAAASAISIAAPPNPALPASSGDLTHAGAVVGTPAYMSPEQTQALELDARSDLFSLGAVLYEALTGRAAFRGTTRAASVDAIVNDAPLSMAELRAGAPANLVAVVSRALERDPERRYQTAAELAAALESCRDAADVRTHDRSRSRARRAVTSAAIVLPLISAVAWMLTRIPNSGHPPDPPLVAVRELRNLSGDPSQGYFAAGMTEEIRGQLSKISTLRLLSREAVDTYRDRGVDRMAADLGVRSVVDGSVRLDHGRVRISVELVDARDRHTQWSDQYERDVSDVFAVQSDVALRIARALQANLSPAERARVERRPTDNLEAYDLYLKSLQVSPVSAAQTDDARTKLLERAVALDPRFAVAKSSLAFRTYFKAARVNDREGLDRAVALADDAASIDPMLAYPHFVLGSVHMTRGRDAAAQLEFLKALELDPNYVLAMQNLAYNEFQFGRLADALLWARRAFAVSARGGNDYYHVAIPLSLLRDDATSLRWIAQGERRAPDDARVQILFGAVEMLGGDRAGALARMQRATARWPAHFEILQTRAEFAFLAGTSDAKEMTENLYRIDPGTIGNAVAESVRVRRVYLSRNYALRNADIEEVLRLTREQLDAGNENPAVSVDMAAGFMLRGDRGPALDSLAAAVKRGYRDYGFLSIDPIFASLAQDTRFRALISEMTRDVALQRQRAVAGGLLDLASLDSALQ